MAAAEYFGSGARPPLQQQNSGLHPPPAPQRANSQPSFAYRPGQPGQPSPQFPAQQPPYGSPPPYHPLNGDQKPNVHFAPSPAPPNQHRPSFSNQASYHLNQPNFQANPAQQLSPYPPNHHNPYIPPGYVQQQQQYLPPPNQRPHRPSQDSAGYSSDPEPHRRKHKSRPRRISDNSRSTNTDGLLGAAGGGLIGDLIFPGLGTVGGALVGWVGGKDYGKHRKWREEKRDREQEKWERKYRGSRSRSRSRSRDRDRDGEGRGHSHDNDRRHSHDRRKNYD